MVGPQICGASSVAYVQAAEGQREGWLQEGAAAHKLAAVSLCLVLQEHGEGHRTGKGHSLEKGGGGEGSSFPVGAKKLQEEGEDIDNV